MLDRLGRSSAFAVLACALAAGGVGAEDALVVKGRVIDARTGEAIAKALVRLRHVPLEARTDAAGAFELHGVPEGAAELYVSTVGYGLVKKPITVAAPGPTDVTVLLGQDAILRSEEVEVTTPAFEETEKGAAAEDTLDNLELRNLSSVLADDTLRSVQTLPGVATGDDFNATFSVRGFGFENVGLYIDGVLAASPFHTIRDVNDGYSLSILNGDMVDAVSLVSSAAPARYGDRVGAALNVQTREGSFERRVTRAHLGAAGVSFSSEGPLGAKQNSSWLVAGRKSFLDYVINRIEEDPSFVVGYHDLQAKLVHRAGTHLLSLFALYGDAVWKERDPGQSRNSIARADAGTQLVSGRWRYTPGARLSLTANAYATRETGRNSNRGQEALFRANAWQTGLRGDATLKLGGAHTLEGGVLLRRLLEDSDALVADGLSTPLRSVYAYDRPAWQPGAYLQDTLSLFGEKLRVTLGGRFDHWSATGDAVFLPRASAVWSVSKQSRLSAGVGGYAQFPSLARLLGEAGNPQLAPERSSHYLLAYERLLRTGLRVRVEAYQQRERDRLFVPGSEFRLVDGVLTRPLTNPRFQNSLSGRSRGVEFLLQRRSANGLAGWISYAYGHARLHDAVTGARFDSDFDQRHTVNGYASWRLNDRWNVSSKYRYGSNVPIVGFYRAGANGLTSLGEDRNLLRVPAYSRLDLRANRAFFFKRSKLTAYAEISNVLNRTHYRYTDTSLDLRTQRVFFERDTLFPILPAAGVTLEF
jgi:outer membrane receptor for ferrienterochelin and colicin